MELRVLKYFLMTAREENITKAANLLHITQPTLSRQLIQLEEELGVKLFHRKNHSIVLTEDGMLLKRRAQEIVSLAEKTEQEFSGREGELTGEISIGCGESQNMTVISTQIAQFRREHPLVQFNIYTAIADDIKERIEKGLLDFGMLMEPVDISKYEFIRLPRKEQWGVYVRDDSDLAQKEYVTPRDLADIPLIMVKRDIVKNELSGWFGDYYEHLNIAATYNLLFNAANMVKNQVGAALSIHMNSEYSGLAFVPFYPRLETGAVLAWKREQVFSPATRQFMGALKKYVFSMSADSI